MQDADVDSQSAQQVAVAAGAAVTAGHAECCRLLLRHGVDAAGGGAAAVGGVPSPLLTAVRKGRSSHVDVVTELLNGGAFPDSTIVAASRSLNCDPRIWGLLELAVQRPLIVALQRLAWAIVAATAGLAAPSGWQ